jgi:hypothetical protein
MRAGSKNLATLTTLKAALLVALSSTAALQSHAQGRLRPTASAFVQTTQSGFATPQEAAAALIKSCGRLRPACLESNVWSGWRRLGQRARSRPGQKPDH